MEDILNQTDTPPLYKSFHGMMEAKVAVVNIAYKNKKLFDKIIERGTQLNYHEDFDKAFAIDTEIKEKFIDDDEVMEEMSTPVSAFVTFHSQEAQERALYYFQETDEYGNPNPNYRPMVSMG